MAVGSWLFLRFAKRRGWVQKSSAAVNIIASLPVGRDVFFVVRCGPDVFALVSGHNGTNLIGRWKYEEWQGFKADDAEPLSK